MDFIKVSSAGIGTKKYTEKTSSSANIAAPTIRVDNVADLEAAVAAQLAGQTIEVVGDIVLTESLPILLAATGGRLKGINGATITGAAAATEAILINPAVATETFEYSIEDFGSIKGGANKIGLHVLNVATTKKVNVYIKNTNLNDNGTGVALNYVNSDGSNAIRIYMDGNGHEIESIAGTPKDAGDRLLIRGYNIEENMVIAVVDVAATFMFTSCKLPHEGITGGHATNVISVNSCWTEETAFVPVIPDASDFPGAFSPTIYPAS